MLFSTRGAHRAEMILATVADIQNDNDDDEESEENEMMHTIIVEVVIIIIIMQIQVVLATRIKKIKLMSVV